MKKIIIILFVFAALKSNAQKYGWVPTGKTDTVIKKVLMHTGDDMKVKKKYSQGKLWVVRIEMKYVPRPGEPGEYNKRDNYWKNTETVLQSDKKTKVKSNPEVYEP